jgi:hypothetical protein
MKKNAVKVKPEQTPKAAGTISNAQSTTSRETTSNEAVLDQQQADPFTGQVFDSEEGAINFLLDSVVRRLGADSPEGRDMHDFLDMVLESDPSLREELLAGATIRK